jgi:hypothetical protein
MEHMTCVCYLCVGQPSLLHKNNSWRGREKCGQALDDLLQLAIVSFVNDVAEMPLLAAISSDHECGLAAMGTESAIRYIVFALKQDIWVCWFPHGDWGSSKWMASTFSAYLQGSMPTFWPRSFAGMDVGASREKNLNHRTPAGLVKTLMCGTLQIR